jgi:hypothetical protein
MSNVHHYTIHTGMTDAEGNRQTTETAEYTSDAGRVVREDDAPVSDGLLVRDKFGRETAVSRMEDLRPDSIILLEGIPVTWQTAQDLGYGATVEEMARGKRGRPQFDRANTATDDQADDYADEGLTEYTNLADEAGRSGALEGEELTVASSALDHVALDLNLGNEAALELGADLLTGELREDDPIFHQQLPLRDVRTKVHAVRDSMARSAEKALGLDQYTELQTWATTVPAVRQLLVQHGVAKIKGSKVSWAEVHDLARRYVKGGRA